MPNAPAARIDDQVKHSEAMALRRVGAGIGGVLGFAAGCLLVGLAVTTEVVTAGMATPLVAVAVYVGAGLVVAGSTAVAASTFSNQGAHIGQSIPGSDEGPIISGIDTIHIGTDRKIAAYLGSKVLCNRHKHSAPDSTETIVQGSRTVRLGPGRYPAARIGDKGSCDCKIGHGWDTVIIGGETITVGKIDGSGDDPDAAFMNKVGEWGGAAFLAGTALLAVPAGFVAGGIWGAVRAAGWAAIKFEASSKLIGEGINHLVPAGPLRDTANSLATVLPLFHGGAEAPSEEGGSTEGGSTEGGGTEGEKSASDGTSGDAAPTDSTGQEAATPDAASSDTASSEATSSEAPAAESASLAEAASEADPTRPIGDSPGGLRGGEEAESDAAGSDEMDAADEKAEADEEQPPDDNIYRKDRAPDSSEGRKPGSRKSFINEDGDLEPANPDGEATVQQHVRGAEPAKSDSPYTSFSDQLGTSKDYGGDLLTLDRGRLSQDIASGKVNGVDILNHEDVLAAHDGYITDAQARYDANPTPKNLDRLERAQQDRANSVRDREVLVKGTVPGEYVTRTPAEPPADQPADAPKGPDAGSDGPGDGSPGGSDSTGGGTSLDGDGKSGPDSGKISPDGGSEDTNAPKDAAASHPAGDPLVQIGPHDGGMPGEAPAEQPESGGTGEQSGGEPGADTPTGKADPVVQSGDVLGGEAGTEGETDAADDSADNPDEARPLRTGAKPGDDPTAESVRVGTVRMEEHPDYARTIESLNKAGFEVRPIDEYSPRVAVREIVDQKGDLLGVEKYVELRPGMRFLDLEHEVGHVDQLAQRFGENMPATERYVQRANGRLVEAKNRAGLLTKGQDAIAEYHNRLVEWLRLNDRGADDALLQEHAEGVETWKQTYWDKGLSKGKGMAERAWANEHYPDLQNLSKQYQEAGGPNYAP